MNQGLQTATALVLHDGHQRVAIMTQDLFEKENDYQNFELRNDNAPDVMFTGYQLGFATSKNERNIKRWTDLTIYVTKGGSYICEEIGRTTMDNETDRCTVEIVATIAEIIEFFGEGWLAKKLYENAQIKAAVHVA